MTKYHTLPQFQEEEKKEVVKTVFKKIVGYKYTTGAYIDDTPLTPDRYENVLHIGYDSMYGDVFKCWDKNINNFAIFFGIAGDEFKK